MASKTKPRPQYARLSRPGDTAPAYHREQGSYRYGDGDVVQPRRIGSDHSHLKSKGYLC